VIKRIRFVARSAEVTPAAFAAAWPAAVAAMVASTADAPPAVRPLRVTASVALPELSDPGGRPDGICAQWFADDDHLSRFMRWSADDDSTWLVAQECVLRGADWLRGRWRDGGEKLTHVAVAVRAAGLSPAEFSRRWRDHAGQVRPAGAPRATVIPPPARGRAYVQNHPVPPLSGEWAYDAVSEVWFDDVASLRTRIEWFAGNAPDRADGELFGRSWFIAAREVVLA
jgi:hypothetical protein